MMERNKVDLKVESIGDSLPTELMTLYVSFCPTLNANIIVLDTAVLF